MRKYTPEQTRQAIRQYTWIAREMRLTNSELDVMRNVGKTFTLNDVKSIMNQSQGNASRLISSLINKHYVRRVACGKYEKL